MRKNLGIIGTIGLAVSLVLSGCSSGPTQLEEIYDTCGSPYEFSVGDDGKVLLVEDTLEIYDVLCLLEELEAPDWFYVKFGNTSTLDGWQKDSLGKYDIEWQYHYEYGASVIVRENNNKKSL